MATFTQSILSEEWISGQHLDKRQKHYYLHVSNAEWHGNSPSFPECKRLPTHPISVNSCTPSSYKYFVSHVNSYPVTKTWPSEQRDSQMPRAAWGGWRCVCGGGLFHVPPEALVFQSKVKTGKWNQIPLVSKLAQINTNMQTISYHLVSLLIRCKWEKHADEINHIRRGSYWGRNSLWGSESRTEALHPGTDSSSTGTGRKSLLTKLTFQLWVGETKKRSISNLSDSTILLWSR